MYYNYRNGEDSILLLYVEYREQTIYCSTGINCIPHLLGQVGFCNLAPIAKNGLPLCFGDGGDEGGDGDDGGDGDGGDDGGDGDGGGDGGSGAGAPNYTSCIKPLVRSCCLKMQIK